jgi:rod shape-determining protein MreC
MKKKKLEIKYIILIILAVITLFLGIFSITKDESRELTKVEIVLKDTITFFQRLVYKPFNAITDKIEELKDRKEVYNENERLKIENEQYELLKAKNKELKEEIEALKELNNITNVLSEYEHLNASVITRNVSIWYNSITIDKGANNGVETGMAVITTSGLIGQITEVTNFTSTVRLITSNSSNNRISVIIQNNTNTYGIINKYYQETELLIAEATNNTTNIKVGDTVTTSGLGGTYPSGILIGKVKNIKTDEYDLAKLIEIEPSTNINDLKYITIIKRKSEN